MKILILGSGLLGVATAYELGKRGFEVTVLDRQPGCGAETSFANGGQLSYMHAEPWANPGVLPKLPKWLFSPDAPLVLRRLDWQMMRWGLKFLRNCTPTRARTHSMTLLRLGLYSRECMEKLRADTGIEFDFSDRGILNIFGNQKDFDAAKRQNDFQAKFGGGQRVLTPAECLAHEPSLSDTGRTIVGGIHSQLDELGDAYTFCNELARLAAERYGVKFICNVRIDGLMPGLNDDIESIFTDQGEMTADAYVMAMGSYTPLYLRPIGIDVPIYPMKGYSITLDANEACPTTSVADDSYKVVYTRLGHRLRIAGTAEFAGYNAAINQRRIAPILRSARALFPNADWNQEPSYWGCLRPSTPDGPPILGHTPYKNLFLNTGHGTLGWTQAAGSAFIVADLMERKTPGIMLGGLTLERYV